MALAVSWKKNDLLPPASGTILNADNTPVNLTGCTIKWLMRDAQHQLKINAPATITSALTGAWSYTPVVGDTNTAGAFEAELEVAFPSGKVETFPNRGYITVRIDEDVDITDVPDAQVQTITDIVNGLVTTLPNTYVPQAMIQVAEGTAKTAFKIQPFTAGNEPFQVIAQSFINTGVGAGTYNHAVHMGFNAGRHTGGTGVVNNKPAIVMGFEDNYYDDGGDAHWGVEWYVEYWSPDGTSQQQFRSIYTRIYSDSNAVQDAVTLCRIGNGAVGQFTVRGAADGTLFSITNATATITKPLTITGAPLSVHPSSGQAGLLLGSPSAPYIRFDMGAGGATPAWYLEALSLTSFIFADQNARTHLTLTQGASAAAALTALSSSLRVDGNVGFYTTAPIVKPTGTPAASTDLATVVALANSLRTSLLALGLVG